MGLNHITDPQLPPRAGFFSPKWPLGMPRGAALQIRAYLALMVLLEVTLRVIGFSSFCVYSRQNPGWRLRAEQEPQRATGSTHKSNGALGALAPRSPTRRPWKHRALQATRASPPSSWSPRPRTRPSRPKRRRPRARQEAGGPPRQQQPRRRRPPSPHRQPRPRPGTRRARGPEGRCTSVRAGIPPKVAFFRPVTF